MQACAQAIDKIRRILSDYTFRAIDERDLAVQVGEVLQRTEGLHVRREVTGAQGRYDLLVEVSREEGLVPPPVVRLVLELKVSGTAEAVERQAQRYARDEEVDAVVLVTSSRRLALEILRAGAFVLLEGVECLGGKPFSVIALRAL